MSSPQPPAITSSVPSDGSNCPQPHCPEILYDRSGVGGPRRGVEVDDSDIYWCEVSAADGNVVRAAPKDGSGPVRTLGRWYDFSFGPSLVVDQAHVYWLDAEDTGRVVQVDKNGSNPKFFALPPDDAGKRLDIGPLTGTSDAIIVATHGCEKVIRVPKDGSPTSSWDVSPYDNAGATTSLRSYTDALYCANGAYIHKLDLTTGSVTPLVSSQDFAGALSLVDESLYFVNNRGVANTGENLAVLPQGDAEVRGLGPAFGFVDQSQYDQARKVLYWTTGLNATTAEVARYQLGGTEPPELLFGSQDVMGGNASDATYLYWLSQKAVTRLQKWP